MNKSNQIKYNKRIQANILEVNIVVLSKKARYIYERMYMFKNLSNAAEIVAKSLNTATRSMENFGICIYRSGK